VVVMNSAGFAQSLTVSLTGSMYNGSGVPCFGMQDGNILSTVSGGTAPYTYRWTNGATTANLTGVPAGYYGVTVTDVNGLSKVAEITLTEPEPLKVDGVAYKYPNGNNISCYECFNGSIDVTVTQGTAPYTYTWSDAGSTTQDRTALGASSYGVIVRDANGCELKYETTLDQPDRNDWTMSGNTGTNPATQYIGTSDAQDVVFKSNGQESMRLKANGGISLTGSLTGVGPLYRNAQGDISLLRDVFPQLPPELCAQEIMPFWSTDGQPLNTCSGCLGRFGSSDACDVNFIANNTTRMRLTSAGHFQLGGDLDVWSMDAVPARMNIQQGHGTWLALYTRAPVPGGAAAHWGIHNPPEQNKMVFYFQPSSGDPIFNLLNLHSDGKVSIGDVSTYTPDNNYKLYVQGGLLTERVKVAIRTSIEWSDHVFLPGYQLMPLKEVSQFIAENGHLPGVPSAECMVEDGLDVVKTDAMLLEKIEELTLHTIDLNTRLEHAERMIATLMEQLTRTTE